MLFVTYITKTRNRWKAGGFRWDATPSSQAPVLHPSMTLTTRSWQMLQVAHHPQWVETLEAALEPLQRAILDLPVVVDASDDALDPASVRNFCVEFYPIIRDFPYWLEVLLKRSRSEGEAFFRSKITAERRNGALWRAMSVCFGVPPECFDGYIPSNPTVIAFHNFLTDIGANAPFASAVAATSYAVQGMAGRIATKVLQGLLGNDRLGTAGREWLEEHARGNGALPSLALKLIKTRRTGRDAEPQHVQDSALRSLVLLRDAMDESYHR